MPQQFATTQWSIVASAARPADSPSARQALAELCRRYWAPLYAFARRTGMTIEAAQDATQDFFARTLERNLVGSADPNRGRFRNFLLASFKNFLANERERAGAQKRGGDVSIGSIDWAEGESRLSLIPVDLATPAKIFDRAWVTTLLDHVLNRLRVEYQESGRQKQFDLLQASLFGPREGVSYAEAAVALETTEDAARQAAQRLRKRYRELLRDEVASTVADESEIDDEIRLMFLALS